MAPKVSILAPSYNHEAFLPACLASVCSQTFPDWELILVDDGSRDGSVEAARQVKDSRIRVEVNQENLGTYGTLQKALDLSSAPLVAVLNTDDVWEEEKLARQVQALTERPSASFCFTLGHQLARDGSVEPGVDVHADWPLFPEGSFLPWLLHENRILASSVVFRREGLRFETSCRYSGDWVALIEASLRGPGACIPEKLSHWRVHGGNAHLMSAPRLVEEIRVREAILAQAGGWLDSQTPEGRDRLARGVVDLLALYAAAGMRGKAFSLLGRAAGSARKGQALKRWAAALLPRQAAVRRLWPQAADSFLAMVPSQLAASLASQPPLVFRGR